MEDLGNFKVIFYIVLAILYFLFTGKKKSQPKDVNLPSDKNKENQPVPSDPKGSPSVYKSKPLLQIQPKPISTVSKNIPEKEPYTIGDILTQFGTPKAPVRKKEILKESSEESNIEVVDYDEQFKDEVTTLSENTSKPSSIVFGKDEHYVAPSNNKNKYADMLNDPEGVKTAFIAGEIFNRKY